MKIVQANVGRGGPAHDLLLSFEADIILVQEPWTDITKQRTKTLPRYQLFSPTTRWETRPRTLTYVRRDLQAHSLPQPASPDITAVYVADMTIINVYRPPGDLVTPARAATIPSTLHTLLQYSLPPNSILAGDFNTYHPLWQPGIDPHRLTAGATALTEWLETHELALCIEPGTPTHGPNTLDLAFSNFLAQASVESYLNTSSDHATILITVDSKEPPLRLKLGSTDWERARALLSPPDPDLPITILADQLIDTAQTAIRGASRYNTRNLPRTP